MEGQSAPIEIKIVLAGESSVGKTCVVERVLKNEFVDDQSSTLGALYSTLESEIDGKNVIYQIWDTAGQEKYRSLIPSYTRGASIILLTFDVTNKEYLESLFKLFEVISTSSCSLEIIEKLEK